jgi:hypothetical protein
LLLVNLQHGSCAFIGFPPSFHNPGQSFSPFLLWNTDVTSFRYQQVYQASGFAGADSGEFLINELIFFPSGTSPNGSVVLPNIRINLSTTSRIPDGLSTVLADNVGPNDTVVYSGTLNFFQTDWGIYRIHLQTPFVYDSKSGNLLIDVRNFQPVPIPPGGVRAYNSTEITLGDSISAAFASDVNALTGGTSTSGLETVFDVTIIPEPATRALLVLGGLVYALATRKKPRISRPNVFPEG